MRNDYKSQRRKRRPRESPRARPDTDTLTYGEELFALEFLANGYNATAAYKATHPRCRSAKAATVEGHRTLVKPRVKQCIQREIEAQKKRLRMDADEALEGITRLARADIGDLFDETGRLLPVKQMPAHVRDAIKAIKHTAFGPTIVMYDKLKARELMAIAAGALKQQHAHKHTFDHAAYLGAEPPPED